MSRPPLPRTLRKIAIANRGEAAMRFIRAARDAAAEWGDALETIALVTPPDASSLFAREADVSVPLPVLPGERAVAAYLDPERVVAAAVAAGADALWPGWGFLSEDARLVEAAEAAGLTFIGPPAHAMRIAGDKIEAKRLAERCGIPVVPWSGDALGALTDVRAVAARLGYPVVLKAAAGGGGRGIRIVRAASELDAAFESSSGEALRAFGDGRLFVERCLDHARHLEVQVVVGADGDGLAFGVRDCTVQRRHQKVIEECPGPFVDAALTAQLESWALAFARAAGYRNAGTVEFIVEARDGAVHAYFMEMNARLQVEHPVTELVYGVDLVRYQLRVAMGLPLPPHAGPRGAAIEVRLNAEDPDDGFAPAPGRLSRFSPPLGAGIRVDSGVAEGSEVPPDFDSNIAKIIAWGATRAEALARLRRALSETVVMVSGGATNKGLLADLLTDPDVVQGRVDTRWLDRRLARPRPFAAEALAVAAVLGFREEGRRDLSNFYAAVARGVPLALPDAGHREIRLRTASGRALVSVLCIGFGRYRVAEGGVETVVHVGGSEPGHAVVGTRRFRLVAQGDERAFVVELDGVSHRVARDPGGEVRAQAPAVVMEIAVGPGDRVTVGQRLGVLEAMKMEMPIVAAEAGRVREVKVGVGSQVAAGQALILLDAAGSDGDADEGGESGESQLSACSATRAPDDFLALFDGDARLKQAALSSRRSDERRSMANAVIAEARSLMLGYGLVAERVERLSRLLDAEASFERLADPDDWGGLESVLRAFSDVELLFARDLDEPVHGGLRMSNEARFWEFARHLGTAPPIWPTFLPVLRSALAHYGATEASSPAVLRHVLARLAVARSRLGGRAELRHRVASGVLRLVMALHRGGADYTHDHALRTVLEQLPLAADPAWPFVADNAMQARYVLYHQPVYEERERDLTRRVNSLLDDVVAAPDDARAALQSALVDTPHSVSRLLARATRPGTPPDRRLAATEAMFRRIYEHLRTISAVKVGGLPVIELGGGRPGLNPARVLGVVCSTSTLELCAAPLEARLAEGPAVVEVLVHTEGVPEAAIAERVLALTRRLVGATRVTMVLADDDAAVVPQWTFAPGGPAAVELENLRNLHPELAERLELWRYSAFELTRIESHDRLVVFRAKARQNPRDERLFVIGEVRDVPEGEVLDDAPSAVLAFEHAFHEAMRALREVQARRDVRARYLWNRVTLHVRPVVMVSRAQVRRVATRLASYTEGLGLERVDVRARHRERPDAPVIDLRIMFSNLAGRGVEFEIALPPREPIRAATPYELKLRAANAYGVTYPYEVIRSFTEGEPTEGGEGHGRHGGRFYEYDLDGARGLAVPVSRPLGGNSAGVVFGILKAPTRKVPEGLERVLVLSDPLHRMGALAEPECRRLMAAIDLADARGLCIEWLATSAGALIAMDSGTENLDWTARVLRRIIEFTRKGGAIHVIVDGVNVGAQSYFNAEATMLMHTRGLLVMTPRGSMVLTGKKALDASGGVSAEDERGIGGYERIMGSNGEAQVLARDLRHAFAILSDFHDVATIVPGEDGIRRRQTHDADGRDVTLDPYVGEGEFRTVGDVFTQNPERKKPFSMRAVMMAVIDRDTPYLERFADMRHSETAITWESHLGGHAITLIGIESRPLPRRGWIPGDGPDTWTGGTLFPGSSKKVARAIRSASGVRPVVVLANLSGFDGSPESMRRMQLEYGAEIGRAVVEFEGPIVFCVVARYHGGAYVVFSKALNENLVALAVEGSYASVIGGAPAAAVVFPREVDARTSDDPRVTEARAALDAAPQDQKPRLREQLARVKGAVKAEKQAELAREFDAIHSVARAKAVGSLDDVIPASALRPRLIAAIRGDIRGA
ncbi:MAG: ATP-grasp domain-containing protein [Myxococcales bacterium]|nr:ATP-grasp domain-containing protein [Myxococcales bacterium]